MSFKEAVTTCFRKYADFAGRARRSEFWYFCLFTGLVTGALSVIFGDGSFITTAFSVATFVPSLAVSWRRMHDIGKSGAWNFLAFVPVVGTIIVLIWECRDSESGTNAYGPNPKKA